jgi:hypothetical protein
VSHRQVDILASKVDVIIYCQKPQIDRPMRLGKATKPVDEPFGGKVRRHAYRQDARLLPLHKARRSLGPSRSGLRAADDSARHWADHLKRNGGGDRQWCSVHQGT